MSAQRCPSGSVQSVDTPTAVPFSSSRDLGKGSFPMPQGCTIVQFEHRSRRCNEIVAHIAHRMVTGA